MSPIRTESSQELANQEGKILVALEDLKNWPCQIYSRSG